MAAFTIPHHSPDDWARLDAVVAVLSQASPACLERGLVGHLDADIDSLQRLCRRVTGLSIEALGRAVDPARLRSRRHAGPAAAAPAEAVTFLSRRPGQHRAAVLGPTRLARAQGPWGHCWGQWSARGWCHLGFGSVAPEGGRSTPCPRDPGLDARLYAFLEPLWQGTPQASGPVVVAATEFQERLWRILLSVPAGSVVSYRELAEAIGQPQAARAVARGVADNPVALVIPCHRVVRHDGTLGGYRWGVARKAVLLARERAAAATAQG